MQHKARTLTQFIVKVSQNAPKKATAVEVKDITPRSLNMFIMQTNKQYGLIASLGYPSN